MTVFYKSTVALRRSLAQRCNKRLYTQLSHPVHRVSQSTEVSTTFSRLRAKNWTLFVPTVITVLGLGFSTFSAHQQIMCCNNTGLPIDRKH